MSGTAPVVVALGEVLWDRFPTGPRFGGAPANFASHAAALGADVTLVSRVGDDALGRQALDELAARRVRTHHISQDEHRPTGTVEVALNPAGVPSYTIALETAWDNLVWSDELDALAAAADAVYFGTLGQRSAPARRVIQRFVAATPSTALRVLDVNLRAPFIDESVIRDSLALATILKLSDEELEIVSRASNLDGPTTERLEELRRHYDLRCIALTRGPGGALLMSEGQTSDFPGVPTTVKDTVGAGDSFTAALTLGLLRGDPLDSINRHACRIAAYVCSQDGATPTLPDTLTQPFRP